MCGYHTWNCKLWLEGDATHSSVVSKLTWEYIVTVAMFQRRFQNFIFPTSQCFVITGYRRMISCSLNLETCLKQTLSCMLCPGVFVLRFLSVYLGIVYFLPQALEFWTSAKWKNLLLAPGSKWRTHAQNVFFRWGRTDITHVIKWTRPSSSIFACCKRSKTGWWKALLYTKLCPPGNL